MSDLNEPGGKFGADPDTRRLVIAAKFGRPGAEADLRHRLQRHRGPARGRNRQILDRREDAARVFGKEHADRNLAVRQREYGGVLVDVAQRREADRLAEGLRRKDETGGEVHARLDEELGEGKVALDSGGG